MALAYIFKIITLLPFRLRAAGLVNIVLIAVATSFQSLLVLTIQPFLSIFENKQVEQESGSLFNTISAMSEGSISPSAAACLIFILVAIGSMILRLLAGWISGSYTSRVGNEISIMALNNLLSEPYVIQGQKNTAHKIADIQQGQTFASGILAPVIQLIASAATIIATIVAALKVSYQATSIAFGGAIVIFIGIAIVTKNMLKRDGKRTIINSRRQMQLVTESFAGFRDLALESRADLFINEYEKTLNQDRMIGVRIGFLQTAPRFLIEGIGFTALGLIGLTFVLLPSNDQVISLGVLGSLALAFQIILPSLQQSFNCWSSIRSGTTRIKLVKKMLEAQERDSLGYEYKSWPKIRDQRKLRERENSHEEYTNQLVIKNASFFYPAGNNNHEKSSVNGSENLVLTGVNLQILKGDIVGIAGKTGSGKSTIVDIISGLAAPTFGSVTVDSVNIFENPTNRSWWLQQISYVPQSIFLTDSTIVENILLGAAPNSVDWQRLRCACDVAQASEFIEKLPLGFDTPIGEAGVKLSGGQKQRIGLARAMYKNRSVLILDEATSALDMRTEKEVIDGITSQQNQPTIIMVAHRLTTLERCNRFFIFEHGRLTEPNSYQELASYFGSGAN